MSARVVSSPDLGMLGRPEKLQPRHLARLAVVYVRQSTMHQVHHHQESTRLQYGLREVAERLGWPRDRICIIDDDLGMSGASAEGRAGFQRLLSEVALDHVGLVLGVEMSRLARSCKDWYQLLEICALFGTLIGDLDGLYDPAQYNDRLLLGLKGTMSEAELHVLKQRLWQGRLQKARRGALALPLPMGYVRQPSGEVALDPDEEVRAVVQGVFAQFARLGTVDAVLRHLVAHGSRLGIRVASGPAKGALEWRRPTAATLRNVLRNPLYAGAYVYGRTRTDPRRQQPGRRGTGRPVVPREAWTVCLRDARPAYLTWAQYEGHLAQLAANQSRPAQPGAIRGGGALLQGLVVCGRCGQGLNTWRGRTRRQARYACVRERAAHGGPRCQSFVAAALDAEVARLALAALAPAALEVSLRVSADLAAQRAAGDAQWQRRLERAGYEAARAARQYHAVEPEHRLVARTLERAWEETLAAHRALTEDYARAQRTQPRGLTDAERAQIQALAIDLPGLWHAPTTTDAERKAILRQLVDRVVVTVEGRTEWVEAVVHWAGGQRTYTRLRRPVDRTDQLARYAELRERLRTLRAEGRTSREIAAQLLAEGWRPPKRRATFNAWQVRTLLSRMGVTPLGRDRASRAHDLRAEEWWLPDLARELGWHEATLREWARAGRVAARQIGGRWGLWVVRADAAERDRLRARRPKGVSTGAEGGSA